MADRNVSTDQVNRIQILVQISLICTTIPDYMPINPLLIG